jgi:large subunit ribosomal protein L15
MPHKLRKIRKFRGSRTVGYGRIGQHRDSGSKGYRKVGRHKHLWSYVTTYMPDYFSRSGFTSPQAIHKNVVTINLEKLAELAVAQDGKQTVDLTSLGYTKLLGTGKISKAIVVTVPSASKKALEKIQEAGGQVITPQEAGE